MELKEPSKILWSKIQSGEDGSAYQHINGLMVISSWAVEDDGKKWQHVSMSRKSRLPSYDDIQMVKEHFIGDDSKALMVFPSKDKHVNIHKFCLHLWHCLEGDAVPEFSKGGMI